MHLSKRTRQVLGAAVAATCVASGAAPALAQDDPAVSGVSPRLSAYGGVVGGERAAGGVFTLTAPLGQSFGAQIEGDLAGLDEDAIGGVTGHVFWRDPDVGLLGFFGGAGLRTDVLDSEYYRGGVEGQLYLGRFGVDAAIGYEITEDSVGDETEGAYGRLDLDYYASDDFLVTGAYRRVAETNLVGASAEYQAISSKRAGLSFFADGRVSLDESEDYSVVGGVRIYIDQPKSLIDRHRKDDPQLSTTFDNLNVVEIIE